MRVEAREEKVSVKEDWIADEGWIGMNEEA